MKWKWGKKIGKRNFWCVLALFFRRSTFWATWRCEFETIYFHLRNSQRRVPFCFFQLLHTMILACSSEDDFLSKMIKIIRMLLTFLRRRDYESILIRRFAHLHWTLEFLLLLAFLTTCWYIFGAIMTMHISCIYQEEKQRYLCDSTSSQTFISVYFIIECFQSHPLPASPNTESYQ